jgi:uncharacterized protein (DUF433 family)
MGIIEAFDGCYPAARAASLSGVPVSTVYDWARKGLVVPSISETREKLWSYADLMVLRITYWLRHPKVAGEVAVGPSPMASVREAFRLLGQMQLDIWAAGDTPVRVDRTGGIHLVPADGSLVSLSGQSELPWLDLLGPFDVEEAHGPNLVEPRPRLRIVPGKVSGEPHLAGTRITTAGLAALSRRGFSIGAISALYPHEDAEAIGEAIELERELGTLKAA